MKQHQSCGGVDAIKYTFPRSYLWVIKKLVACSGPEIRPDFAYL